MSLTGVFIFNLNHSQSERKNCNICLIILFHWDLSINVTDFSLLKCSVSDAENKAYDL